MNCPICRKDSNTVYRPFCSKRCADIDLGKWLKGEYAFPSRGDAEVAEEAPEQVRRRISKPD